MRVRWLRDAQRSHDEEATHIAPDDPVSARLVVKKVLEAVATLEDQPALRRPGGMVGIISATPRPQQRCVKPVEASAPRK